MEKTKLYLPYTDFTINDKQGEQRLLEALISNGPAYKVIVHESDEWHRIKDELLVGDRVEIISSKEAGQIKEKVDRFFLPVIEDIPYLENRNGNRFPSENMTVDLRRVLSYIVIANKKKAWIYEDEIIKDSLEEIGYIIDNQKYINDEGLNRVKALRDLLQSYNYEEIKHLSVSDNKSIAHDFFDFMDDSLAKELSESNFNFGVIKKDIGKVKRDVKDKVTAILQSSKFPYLHGGTGLLTILADADPKVKVVLAVAGIIKHALRDVDLREYAPPMARENLFTLQGDRELFSFSYFNYTCPVYIRTDKRA
jgi:hypothetical protein